MKILMVELGYVYDAQGSTTKAERREVALAAAGLSFVGTVKDGADTIADRIGRHVIMTQEQFVNFYLHDPDVKIVHAYEVDTPQALPTIIEGNAMKTDAVIQSAIDHGAVTLGEHPGNRDYNHKVEVHMPGVALATYNEVMLIEDACSDEVQTALDEGWRIDRKSVV